jgi:hypothetical protein
VGKPPAERTNIKTLRLTDDELNRIEQRMKLSGARSFSAFARQVLIDGDLRVRHVTFDPTQLRVELSRIGNNLNQIARRVNAEQSVTAAEALQARRLMQEVQRLISDATRGQ